MTSNMPSIVMTDPLMMKGETQKDNSPQVEKLSLFYSFFSVYEVVEVCGSSLLELALLIFK